MGYHKAKKGGATRINTGTEKDPKFAVIKFNEGDIIEQNYPNNDIKKGTFDHVDEKVIEYNTGKPPKDGEEEESSEEESSEE